MCCEQIHHAHWQVGRRTECGIVLSCWASNQFLLKKKQKKKNNNTKLANSKRLKIPNYWMKKNALRKHNDFIYDDCSVEIAMLFWNSQKNYIISAETHCTLLMLIRSRWPLSLAAMSTVCAGVSDVLDGEARQRCLDTKLKLHLLIIVSTVAYKHFVQFSLKRLNWDGNNKDNIAKWKSTICPNINEHQK